MLIYGSILSSVTRRPRDSSKAPSDAAARPLPSDETTPPVTKMNLFLPSCSTLSPPPLLARRRIRPCEVVRRVHFERRCHRPHNSDSIPALQGTQLLELFDLFQH